MADGCVQILFFLCIIFPALASHDEFHEELLIKPLSTGHVYTYFQFTTLWDVDIKDRRSFLHFNLFPKSFGQIVDKYSVEELHLSLTQGHWKSDLWGYPVISAPPGAELWVWFQNKVKNSVNENWKGLTQALSGQFCSSLNVIESKTSVSPQLSFRREGVASTSSLNSSLLRYSALGREIVCTENLTPWKKLLPCDSKAGIATLFNALFIYEANYHSMGIHLRPMCKDSECKTLSLELKQTISIVFDPHLRSPHQLDWSFRKLFAQVIRSECPLSTSSRVLVDITRNETGNIFTLKPAPSRFIPKQIPGDVDQQFAIYEVKNIVKSPHDGNVAFKWKQRNTKVNLPQLHAHRFLTGYGEKKGGVNCLIYNNHPTKPLQVIYLETYPWFVKIFLHTLKIESNKKLIKPDKMHFVPAKDRERPFILELVFTLPAKSVTKMSIQFERGFLKWTEHPPDAHHGFYISSAVISARLHSAANLTSGHQWSSLLFPRSGTASGVSDRFVRLHTETLLLSLPTPDFSMPYNVICMTCTVVAIAFGSYHNLCVRRFEDIDPKDADGTYLGKVKAKLKNIKETLFSSKKAEVSEEKKTN